MLPSNCGQVIRRQLTVQVVYKLLSMIFDVNFTSDDSNTFLLRIYNKSSNSVIQEPKNEIWFLKCVITVMRFYMCFHQKSFNFLVSGENVAQISTERMAIVLVGIEIFSQSYQIAFKLLLGYIYTYCIFYRVMHIELQRHNYGLFIFLIWP